MLVSSLFFDIYIHFYGIMLMNSFPYYHLYIFSFPSGNLLNQSHRGYIIKENDIPSTSDSQHPLQKEGYWPWSSAQGTSLLQNESSDNLCL